MQIIQPLLGNNDNPLGIRSSLSNPHRMILRKESHSLHLRNNFISTVQTKPPLVTSSKFLLSREHEPSIEPLIGWDNQDINSDFPLMEFDYFDSIAPLENSNVNSSESVKDSIPEILSTRIHNNTNNDISQELNTKSKGKSKSKKTNKSQQLPETKSKSRAKKAIKSSTVKNVEQLIDQSSITINNNENSLLASDQLLSIEANLETPTLQLDIASDNTKNDNDFVSIITPSALPIVEDKSTLFRNINNDNLQINSGVTSSSLSADLSVTESILPLQEKSELAENLLIEFPLSNNVKEIFIPSSNFTNNEQQVIPEASESFNILDIPVSPTLSKQDIETYQVPSIVDNKSTTSQTNLIQAKEVSSTSNFPSQDEELPNTNSNFEAITAIKPDLILESTINNFVTDNAVVDNFLTLPSALTLPDVDDAPILLHPLTNDDNTVGAHSYEPLTYIAAPNSEPSVAKNPIAIQQEIDSSVPIEFPATAPVQLTPTSAYIEDTPSLFSNSDSNEQLVTSKSQSAITINVSDVSENVTSLQRDNKISEFTESEPTLVSPEIGESAIANDNPLGVYATIPATSPEIVAETSSIFRKIIDHEQTVKSKFTTAVTNPEILTFVDTLDNLTSPQDQVDTTLEVEQNTTIKNLPAPKGYATGGHVTDSHVENRQQIAHSDTVPAMLTPGEFVINIRDAQKNLPLLHHINTGGTPQDIILPSLQTPNPVEPEEKTSPETPTKVDSFPDTPLQLKSAETHSPEPSNSLIPSSLGLNIGKHKLSILNSPQLNPLQNETINVGEPSPQYSSPPLIFRKVNPTRNTPSQWSNTPSEWSSVEELLNGNNDEFTSFNFDSVESNKHNSEFSHVSESPQVFAKHLPSFRGFADGGEVTPPDISREIEPVTEMIESASASFEGDDKDDTADLEALAREIYYRLRQRIEIERERHGGFSGRLPW